MRNASPLRSYAVTWLEQGSGLRAGKLTVEPTGLRLESGGPHGRLAETSVRYRDIAGAEVARTPGERLGGRPTVLVRRHRRPPLAIAGLNGYASEIVDDIEAALARRRA